jgi:hypothetical protein
LVFGQDCDQLKVLPNEGLCFTILSIIKVFFQYWDKFVRRKTKQKYKEQVDEETLDALLGTERAPGDTSFDYRQVLRV